MRKLCIGCVSGQNFLQCVIYTQYSTKLYFLPHRAINAQGSTYFPNAQYMRKILLLSPTRNIYTRFAQDCTYFSNAQYIRNIVLLPPMLNICTRFAQDCTYFPNAQYMCTRFASPMHNRCTRLYLFPQCTIYAQDCT